MIVNSGTEETVEMLLDNEMINDEAVDVAIEESLKINRIELIPLIVEAEKLFGKEFVEVHDD